MLHEIRTTARTRGGRDFQRAIDSKSVAGVFQTDVGDTGRTIIIKPQAGLDIHGARPVGNEGRRDARGADLFGKHELELVTPAPFMRPLEACELGKLWELRWYDYAPGEVENACAAFGEAMPHREEYYPVVGCWTEAVGPYSDRLYLLMPYKDGDHRDEVTAALSKDLSWPPAAPQPVSGGAKLLIPTGYSQLR